jgi:hypothetical protein
MNWRALCRHYDYDPTTTETKILWAAVYYMTKRLTKKADIGYKINGEHENRIKEKHKNITQTT